MISRGKNIRGKQNKQQHYSSLWNKKQTLAMESSRQCLCTPFFSFQPGSKYIKSEYFRQKLAHLSSVLKPANSVLGVQTCLNAFSSNGLHTNEDIAMTSVFTVGTTDAGWKSAHPSAVTLRRFDPSKFDWQQELPLWLWASVHTCIQKVLSCGSVDCFLIRTGMERWSTHLKTLMWQWGKNQENKGENQQDGGKVLYSFSLSAAAN